MAGYTVTVKLIRQDLGMPIFQRRRLGNPQ